MDESIQPMVLVGGKSRRFGRNKLREPVVGGWLVDRPIAALRAVFGPRVAAVGECDAEIAARADSVIADSYPGVGPIGGILSALEQSCADVFVLPGDLPMITPAVVRSIVQAARERPDAWAVIARGAGGAVAEPCIGLYRPAAIGPLRQELEAGRRRLGGALPPERVAAVDVPAECLVNANTPEDLRHAPRP